MGTASHPANASKVHNQGCSFFHTSCKLGCPIGYLALRVMNQHWDVHNPPLIAVIVAARNEKRVVERLLEALLVQDYPLEQVELLLGNDGSEDSTGDILEFWAGKFPKAHVVTITERIPGIVGKANVLAHLCRLTRAPYMLFTDADCVPPPSWITSMVKELQLHSPNPLEQSHILTGFTVPMGNGAFSYLQGVDWVGALAVIHSLSTFGIPITAMGNNMACTSSAYKQSGGFEATAGSIVEDYTLFRNILNTGGAFSHVCHSDILIKTQAQATWPSWLRQRKRWFSGALQLPLMTQSPFWIQVVFYPVLLCIGVVLGWSWALGAWCVKVGLQSLLFGSYLIRLRLYKLLPWLVPFDFWAAGVSWALLWFYYRNRTIEWKGKFYPAAPVANG